MRKTKPAMHNGIAHQSYSHYSRKERELSRNNVTQCLTVSVEKYIADRMEYARMKERYDQYVLKCAELEKENKELQEQLVKILGTVKEFLQHLNEGEEEAE